MFFHNNILQSLTTCLLLKTISGLQEPVGGASEVDVNWRRCLKIDDYVITWHMLVFSGLGVNNIDISVTRMFSVLKFFQVL